MKIETLDDWNLVLTGCDCCPMPPCPLPTRECESISKTLCGFELPDHPGNSAADACLRFATRQSSKYTSHHFGDGLDPESTVTGSTDSKYIETKVIEGGVCVSHWEIIETVAKVEISYARQFGEVIYTKRITDNYVWLESDTSPAYVEGTVSEQDYDFTNGDPDGDVTIVSGNDVIAIRGHNASSLSPDATWNSGNWLYWKSFPGDDENSDHTVSFKDPLIGPAALEGYEFPADNTGEQCSSELGCGTATKSRFRWVIPDTWAGSYFKITWDEVFFPVGYDPLDPESPQPYGSKINETWEWPGPGVPGDEDTWKSGWYVIDPPNSPGQIRIVNIRYECYRSTKFGTKPQVTGEAVELPAP